MSGDRKFKIALVGNPNSGKSSIFNLLTGLNQKTGNFAGVTVDRKSGICKLDDGREVEILDLPGTYSIYPKSYDEQIVFNILANRHSSDYPDVAVVIVDASNLRRNLLLFTQIYDLGIPAILVLNMIDVAEKSNISINAKALSAYFANIPVVKMNARKEFGLDRLKSELAETISHLTENNQLKIYLYTNDKSFIDSIKGIIETDNDYIALLYANQLKQISWLPQDKKIALDTTVASYKHDALKTQTHETITRYSRINEIVNKSVTNTQKSSHRFTTVADKILTHRIGGYVFLALILLLIFQAIFSFATLPMDIIDWGIHALNKGIKNIFPEHILVDMLTDGLISGLGGVIIFIPQIAMLFAFIALLEETGYMARVMFLMDHLMKNFGLNGKSIVPLFSGAACAIPAIMSTRNITNSKERLITIFVTPLISCSARIPVYTMIIALIIPTTSVFGIFSLQGMAMMALYILGFVMAIVSAFLLKLIVKTEERSFFILEMPDYKMPKWKNIGFNVLEKVKSFIYGAGKIIITISLALWFLSTFGPADAMKEAEEKALKNAADNPASVQNLVAAEKLEASFAGHFGKIIEPVIAPLGFDWKIGIALITSFAAREVFVGTISTIYSIGDDDEDINTLKNKLSQQKEPVTGKPFFNFARGMSLLVFYAFALQCMSTIAIVKKESGKWSIAFLQFIYMSMLAYLGSWLTYSILS